MAHVYGDSTTFPYDFNFIELIRHAVECGVALLQAEHNISTAHDRSGDADQMRRAERARLDAMSDAIRLTMTAFTSSKSERLQRSASRILETSRGVIEAEIAALEGMVSTQQSNTRAAVEHACEEAYRAVEAFILRHDLPGTGLALRLLARDETYNAHALVQTPFGIEAVFALFIPPAHDWGRLRRVAELSAGTELHLPMESGWFSKSVKLQPVKLDKLVVTEVAITAERSMISLRRGARSGTGYQLLVDTAEQTPRCSLKRLGEDGQPTADPLLELYGDDAVHAHRLWSRVVETTHDLALRRQAMTSGSFDGTSLREHESPKDICIRMVNVLAPVVQEIARRSGAPGELVLRRDVGDGRREEIYITKAELHERIMTLPPEMRGVFDSFELSDGPRSPRAPAPSEPIYLDAPMEGESEEVTHQRKG
jgi:hypothetical protein